MTRKRGHGKKITTGENSGREIDPLNESAIFKLEELEKRLEMQSMPVTVGCGVQSPGCYTDGCEGEYCFDYCEGNTCSHCLCEGGWCTLDCSDLCAGVECHAFCAGDICAIGHNEAY